MTQHHIAAPAEPGRKQCFDRLTGQPAQNGGNAQ
jgi:hypothetical protein